VPPEPPSLNEHGEAECPYDATLLDLHSDGTWHCWKCGSTWDIDFVRDLPAWAPRTGRVPPADVTPAATLTGHRGRPVTEPEGVVEMIGPRT